MAFCTFSTSVCFSLSWTWRFFISKAFPSSSAFNVWTLDSRDKILLVLSSLTIWYFWISPSLRSIASFLTLSSFSSSLIFNSCVSSFDSTSARQCSFSSINDFNCCNSSSFSRNSLSTEAVCFSNASIFFFNFLSISSFEERFLLRNSIFSRNSFFSDLSFSLSCSLSKTDCVSFSLHSCNALISLSLEAVFSLKSIRLFSCICKSCLRATIVSLFSWQVFSTSTFSSLFEMICSSNELTFNLKSSSTRKCSCNFSSYSFLSFSLSCKLDSRFFTCNFKLCTSSESVTFNSLEPANSMVVCSSFAFKLSTNSWKFSNSFSFLLRFSLQSLISVSFDWRLSFSSSKLELRATNSSVCFANPSLHFFRSSSSLFNPFTFSCDFCKFCFSCFTAFTAFLNSSSLLPSFSETLRKLSLTASNSFLFWSRLVDNSTIWASFSCKVLFNFSMVVASASFSLFSLCIFSLSSPTDSPMVSFSRLKSFNRNFNSVSSLSFKASVSFSALSSGLSFSNSFLFSSSSHKASVSSLPFSSKDVFSVWTVSFKFWLSYKGKKINFN